MLAFHWPIRLLQTASALFCLLYSELSDIPGSARQFMLFRSRVLCKLMRILISFACKGLWEQSNNDDFILGSSRGEEVLTHLMFWGNVVVYHLKKIFS